MPQFKSGDRVALTAKQIRWFNRDRRPLVRAALKALRGTFVAISPKFSAMSFVLWDGQPKSRLMATDNIRLAVTASIPPLDPGDRSMQRLGNQP
jgi:hypothetical protein